MNTQDVLDPKSWAEQTFGRVQLHDRRRTRRAVQAATNLAANPRGSLPAQMHIWKETKALYRLLDEPDVTTARVDAASRATDQGTSHVRSRGAVGARYHRHRSVPSTQDQRRGTKRPRTRTGIFRANGAGGATSDPRGARVHSEGNLLCAYPLPRENTVINGSSGKSAKPMSGCAKCRPLGRLSREAYGCMSEI